MNPPDTTHSNELVAAQSKIRELAKTTAVDDSRPKLPNSFKVSKRSTHGAYSPSRFACSRCGDANCTEHP